MAGNPSLEWSRREYQGRVLGFFCFDPSFLSRSDFGADRFAFFLETLSQLRDELRSMGSDLLVMDEGPERAFRRWIQTLREKALGLPRTVSWNRDYEPFAVARDTRMIRLFQTELDIGVHHERDHLLIEPHEIIKPSSDTAYQVYTPFRKRWEEQAKLPQTQARIAAQRKGIETVDQWEKSKGEPIFRLTWKAVFAGTRPEPDFLQGDRIEKYRQFHRPPLRLPKAGARAALQCLRDFKCRIRDYARARDYPALAGTSHFSLYLKNGSLTTGQVIAELGLDTAKRKQTGAEKFLSELVWREFYYYILSKFPHVEKGPFRSDMNGMVWEDSKTLFDAWKAGRTGYPIVDAGMRQLAETGWMHNRVRMVVASFLTKDLHINWQWGERYFMEKLLDGDLAPNNGGWQWAASTGCDAQPYFRIFSPELQGKRFDPQGEYVKRWVPELRSLNPRQVHAPDREWRKGRYPQPIVDHRRERLRALAHYQKVLGKKG